MIRVFQTVADLDGDEGRRAVRTGLAFLLAPGIAAVVGGAVLVPALDGGRGSVASALASALFFGLVGYATELVFAAPIYLALPRRAQGAGVIVPLAGVLAAIPWLLISVSYGGAVFARVAAPIAFGLGCLGGVAFALIRGRAGAPPGKRSREAPAKAPEGAAGDALAKSVAAPYPSARPALCTQPGQREKAWSRSGPPGSPTTAG